MLHRISELSGDRLATNDGNAGRVLDLYFDTVEQRVRYLAVETGGALAPRHVLVDPELVDRGRSSEQSIYVALAPEEVERRPGAAKAREMALLSVSDLVGLPIDAADGAVGHVVDVIVDDESWRLASIVAQTDEWPPSRELSIPAAAVEAIDTRARRIRLRLRRSDLG